MATISIKNDKFSANLYKPLLKCSDEIFDSIVNKVKEKFNNVFTSQYHWDVTVEHSQASRNIILITLKYDDSIKGENNNIVTPATYLKKYVLNLNLIAKELSVPSDNLVFGKPEFPYCDMLSKLTVVIGDANDNIFNSSDSDSISKSLEKIENISDSYRIKVVPFPNAYGDCILTSSSKIYDINELENLYSKGTELTIKAIANEHYKFVEWRNGGKSIKENPYTFTVTEHATYNAMFDKESYIVALTEDVERTSANESVAYSIFEGDGMYKYQDTVTLIAKPINGFTFTGWYENDTRLSADLIYKFNIDHDMVIVGKFTDQPIDGDTTDVEEQNENNNQNNNGFSSDTDGQDSENGRE